MVSDSAPDSAVVVCRLRQHLLVAVASCVGSVVVADAWLREQAREQALARAQAHAQAEAQGGVSHDSTGAQELEQRLAGVSADDGSSAAWQLLSSGVATSLVAILREPPLKIAPPAQAHSSVHAQQAAGLELHE